MATKEYEILSTNNQKSRIRRDPYINAILNEIDALIRMAAYIKRDVVTISFKADNPVTAIKAEFIAQYYYDIGFTQSSIFSVGSDRDYIEINITALWKDKKCHKK